MGAEGTFRQSPDRAGEDGPPVAWGPGADLAVAVAGRPVAAFDFDGTLTVRDSFMAFLRWRAGPVRFAAGMARLVPAIGAYLAHRDRGRLKAAAVHIFLKGVSRAALAASARGFAAQAWPALMRPDALEAWRDWKAKGAAVVIVTASPEDVVAPFAALLGADALIGTRLAWDAKERVTGAFDGANCRGQEKVERLKRALGEGVRLIAAYGDTAGDSEMLAMAQVRGFKVFTGRPRPSGHGGG